jgi:3-keto-disaccharide hydrolase
MMMKSVIYAVVAAALATSPALACKGKNVLFEDDFAEPDPAWGMWDAISITDGSLIIKTGASGIYSVLHEADVYDKADMCVDVTIPKYGKPGDVAASLLFGAQYNGDSKNYYQFWISPNGSVGVSRLLNGKWTNPVPSRKVEGMPTAPGSKVTMRVTLNGNRATIYVNDIKVVDFKVAPVEGGGFFGLAAEGTGESWSFDNLKLTDLA